MTEDWSRRLVIPPDAKLEQIIDLLNSMELSIDIKSANPVLIEKLKDWVVEKDMKV